MVLERFAHAALYLAKNTVNFDSIKLYKLLFIADRESVRKLGHTISGCDYKRIMPWGPVPAQGKDLIDKIADGKDKNPLLTTLFRITKNKRGKAFVEPVGNPDLGFFSKKEITILKQVADKYYSKKGPAIAHRVHEDKKSKKMDWGKVFSMDMFLGQKEKEVNSEINKVASCFQSALSNA